jgi:hypothetical protein
MQVLQKLEMKTLRQKMPKLMEQMLLKKLHLKRLAKFQEEILEKLLV